MNAEAAISAAHSEELEYRRYLAGVSNQVARIDYLTSMLYDKLQPVLLVDVEPEASPKDGGDTPEERTVLMTELYRSSAALGVAIDTFSRIVDRIHL